MAERQRRGRIVRELQEENKQGDAVAETSSHEPVPHERRAG